MRWLDPIEVQKINDYVFSLYHDFSPARPTRPVLHFVIVLLVSVYNVYLLICFGNDVREKLLLVNMTAFMSLGLRSSLISDLMLTPQPQLNWFAQMFLVMAFLDASVSFHFSAGDLNIYALVMAMISMGILIILNLPNLPGYTRTYLRKLQLIIHILTTISTLLFTIPGIRPESDFVLSILFSGLLGFLVFTELGFEASTKDVNFKKVAKNDVESDTDIYRRDPLEFLGSRPACVYFRGLQPLFVDHSQTTLFLDPGPDVVCAKGPYGPKIDRLVCRLFHRGGCICGSAWEDTEELCTLTCHQWYAAARNSCKEPTTCRGNEDTTSYEQATKGKMKAVVGGPPGLISGLRANGMNCYRL